MLVNLKQSCSRKRGIVGRHPIMEIELRGSLGQEAFGWRDREKQYPEPSPCIYQWQRTEANTVYSVDLVASPMPSFCINQLPSCDVPKVLASPTAVHSVSRAGHKAAFITKEETDNIGHFLWQSKPLDGSCGLGGGKFVRCYHWSHDSPP